MADLTKNDIIENVVKKLSKYNNTHVNSYGGYLIKLLEEKDRDGVLKNKWMFYKTASNLVHLFEAVNAEGLVFDGKHVTLIARGINYDYVAYKNKMLATYPESQIDVSLVYKGDTFSFRKESGKVIYTHKIKDPFVNLDKEIIGGYCVIKNSRGEFLTNMSLAEINKSKAIAQTKDIWDKWFPQMCKKTVVKKGCSDHFDDLYKGINEMDNEQNDITIDPNLSPEKLVMDRVIEALDLYQGEDLEEIRTMCNDKAKAKEFTVEFGENILKQLGV
jgi:hypothetical protein